MKPIFTFLLGFFLLLGTAQAEYTCNDKAYLKSVLDKLNATCGSADICTAYGYKGSTIEAAINACVAAGIGKSTCNSSADCQGAVVCTAYGYKGSTVEAAIKACVEAGIGNSTCNSSASCK